MKELELLLPGAIKRSLDKSDFPRVLEFERMATYELNDTPPDHAPPMFTMEELEEIAKNGVMGGIFGTDDKLLAYYLFGIRPDELYIEEIVVDSDIRDRGVGRYLLELADEEVQKRGLPRATLSVDPLNGRGVNAYLKHGYEITDYKTAYFGPEYPNTDRFWMVKQFRGEKRSFEEDSKEVNCGDAKGLQATLRDGYIGVGLIRGANNRLNRIIFRK
ncbi:GNAT family N-acetyltransferase [Candidatus Daviesbacteria bacterium]|nr:GNAT family N-acetyltransferase [Candidatus Daviesbacteria bacterium]